MRYLATISLGVGAIVAFFSYGTIAAIAPHGAAIPCTVVLGMVVASLVGIFLSSINRGTGF